MGKKKQFKKFRSAMMLEAIAFNEQQLKLEAQLNVLEREVKLLRSKEAHPSNVKLYSIGKDEKGNNRANLIANPGPSTVPGVPKRLTFSLPKRLGATSFMAMSGDLTALHVLGIPFNANPVHGSSHGLWAVEIQPFVTTKDPRKLHADLNKHFAGRFGFVLGVENV